jgi:hypothetical protein
MEGILMATRKYSKKAKYARSVNRKKTYKAKPKRRALLSKKQEAQFRHLMAGGSLEESE